MQLLRSKASNTEHEAKEFRAHGETWPFDVRRALVLVMAEYARPRHPERSRGYLDAPSLIDLQSPRTQLVPRRFFAIGQPAT